MLLGRPSASLVMNSVALTLHAGDAWGQYLDHGQPATRKASQNPPGNLVTRLHGPPVFSRSLGERKSEVADGRRCIANIGEVVKVSRVLSIFLVSSKAEMNNQIQLTLNPEAR